LYHLISPNSRPRLDVEAVRLDIGGVQDVIDTDPEVEPVLVEVWDDSSDDDLACGPCRVARGRDHEVGAFGAHGRWSREDDERSPAC
jgi:hypothetical protein